MSVNDDIVERLRDASVELSADAWRNSDGGQCCCIASNLLIDAVQEIERLRALIDKAAGHWLALTSSPPPIPWEGAIDTAMQAACGEIERLRARVAELEGGRRWRPIETAPIDTHLTVLLALKNGHVVMGKRWSANCDRWQSLDCDVDWRGVTHWMPLPEPPK